MTERILCAAIWIDDGKWHVHQPVPTGFIVAGHRHHNCYAIVHALAGGESVPENTSGFLTSTGRFVGRAEAKRIAKNTRQIDPRHPASHLYSEDLYDGGAWFDEDGTPRGVLTLGPTPSVHPQDSLEGFAWDRPETLVDFIDNAGLDHAPEDCGVVKGDLDMALRFGSIWDPENPALAHARAQIAEHADMEAWLASRPSDESANAEPGPTPTSSPQPTPEPKP